jgi:hypothetical protein
MWNETICDGGQAALAFTRGSSPSEAISDPVIFASMLLTPEKVAANLSEQKKEHYRTMPRLMRAHSTHRPETMFTDDKLQPAAACYLMMMLWSDYPALAALGTGEIPDAADKGAARPAIIVMAAVCCLMMLLWYDHDHACCPGHRRDPRRRRQRGCQVGDHRDDSCNNYWLASAPG